MEVSAYRQFAPERPMETEPDEEDGRGLGESAGLKVVWIQYRIVANGAGDDS